MQIHVKSLLDPKKLNISNKAMPVDCRQSFFWPIPFRNKIPWPLKDNAVNATKLYLVES